MTPAAQTFVVAVVSVAAAAAMGVSLADHTAAPAPGVVQLERVVVVGQRVDAATVARLPRVVVQGRRATAVDVMQAGAPAAWLRA